jgi:hypothetical protein
MKHSSDARCLARCAVQGKKQQLLDRHPAVEGALSSVCGATGLMRPELGTTCEKILEE